MQYHFYTKDAEETIALATKIGKRLKRGDLISYYGDLGVGKTTFTRGLAEGMGLTDCLVSSPTFCIVNAYESEDAMALSLYHFDMYRITNEMELETTGFFDYPRNSGVFAIEWSENIESSLPKERIRITLIRTSDTEREIIVEGAIDLENLGG